MDILKTIRDLKEQAPSFRDIKRTYDSLPTETKTQLVTIAQMLITSTLFATASAVSTYGLIKATEDPTGVIPEKLLGTVLDFEKIGTSSIADVVAANPKAVIQSTVLIGSTIVSFGLYLLFLLDFLASNRHRV